MKQRDERILQKIADEIDYLGSLLEGVSPDAFLDDEKTKRAAAMTSINIGELAECLSEEFYADHPDNELHYAARTRDVYAHSYYTLRFEAVYKTAVEDYPHIREWIYGIILWE